LSSALSRILEVSQRLGASADLNEILSLIIDALRDVLDAERATVFEHDAGAPQLLTTVAHGVKRETIRIPLGDGRSVGLAGECARTRRIIRVDDAYADERFNPEIDRRTGFRTRSILTIPLLDHEHELVGVAQVLNKRSGAFDAHDEEIARALAAQAAVALRRGRLIHDRLERLRLERELEVARIIQQSSFPAHIPQPQGYEIAVWNQPATQTGGDAYDVIPTNDEHRVTLLMADATGHGVGPALSVTQLCSMLRMAVRLGAGVSAIAQHANAQLSRDLPPGRFITAWLGEIDGQRHELRSLSAGQGPLLLWRAGVRQIESIAVDTVPLGVLDALPANAGRTIPLQPGDVFAAISDGVFEARNPSDVMFGVGRVSEALRGAATEGESAQAIIETVRAALEAFLEGRAADDDRTAIIVRRSV
jgi:phosphoserine phosphatase RsbU/P